MQGKRVGGDFTTAYDTRKTVDYLCNVEQTITY